MNDAKQNEKNSVSLSKTRKIERKKEIIKMKRNARLTKFISICVIILVSVGLVSLIGYSVYRNITRIKPSSNYSAKLTEEGLLKDVQAASYLTLADYSNIKVPLSDIEYSDESVEKDIQTLLDGYSTLETKTDALIADGNKVNIDYVGTVNGEEFEGGNTKAAGTDLVIGSGTYVDDFEKQLIGHGVGDKVTVEVTFPTDYKEATLAGKEAVFKVEINGIYTTPEFNDAFVKKNLSDKATTANEYREYVKQSKYDENFTTWLEDYLMDNTTVSSYPEEYIEHLKSVKKYEDQSSFEYMNQFYASMGSTQTYKTFEQYVGMSEQKYDAGLADQVKDQAKKALIFQTIYEKEGLHVTVDDFDKYLGNKATEGYDSLVEVYGKGYVMQQLIREKVVDFLKQKSSVE